MPPGGYLPPPIPTNAAAEFFANGPSGNGPLLTPAAPRTPLETPSPTPPTPPSAGAPRADELEAELAEINRQIEAEKRMAEARQKLREMREIRAADEAEEANAANARARLLADDGSDDGDKRASPATTATFKPDKDEPDGREPHADDAGEDETPPVYKTPQVRKTTSPRKSVRPDDLTDEDDQMLHYKAGDKAKTLFKAFDVHERTIETAAKAKDWDDANALFMSFIKKAGVEYATKTDQRAREIKMRSMVKLLCLGLKQDMATMSEEELEHINYIFCTFNALGNEEGLSRLTAFVRTSPVVRVVIAEFHKQMYAISDVARRMLKSHVSSTAATAFLATELTAEGMQIKETSLDAGGLSSDMTVATVMETMTEQEQRDAEATAATLRGEIDAYDLEAAIIVAGRKYRLMSIEDDLTVLRSKYERALMMIDDPATASELGEVPINLMAHKVFVKRVTLKSSPAIRKLDQQQEIKAMIKAVEKATSLAERHKVMIGHLREIDKEFKAVEVENGGGVKPANGNKSGIGGEGLPQSANSLVPADSTTQENERLKQEIARLQSKSKASQSSAGADKAAKQCGHCGLPGHVDKDCIKKKKGMSVAEAHAEAEKNARKRADGKDLRECYRCGETGHLARDCPKPEGYVKPKKVVPGAAASPSAAPPSITEAEKEAMAKAYLAENVVDVDKDDNGNITFKFKN